MWQSQSLYLYLVDGNGLASFYMGLKHIWKNVSELLRNLCQQQDTAFRCDFMFMLKKLLKLAKLVGTEPPAVSHDKKFLKYVWQKT